MAQKFTFDKTDNGWFIRLSDIMARKITWILTGDCKRQHEICKTLGREYAMYDAE